MLVCPLDPDGEPREDDSVTWMEVVKLHMGVAREWKGGKAIIEIELQEASHVEDAQSI